MSLPQNPPTLSVDVAIIGAGIQGLWLLADLTEAGYNAIILDRKRPGFGQTGHSHVFLHEGHLYAGMTYVDKGEVVSRIESVSKANALWKIALDKGSLKGLKPLKSNFYAGWDTREKGSTFETNCRAGGIQCDEVSAPLVEFGAGRELVSLYRSSGVCLESKALLDHLLDFRSIRNRVAICDDLSVRGYNVGVFDLLCERRQESRKTSTNTKKRLSTSIMANAIVLVGGAGNEQLIEQVFSQVVPNTGATKQQTVKTFMLVLKPLDRSVSLAAGMFPEFGGAFIVSRTDTDGGTVWLIGDKQRELVSVPGDMAAFDANGWFNNFRADLENLLPEVKSHPENYEWGIYEATKAEPWTVNNAGHAGKMPGSYHIHKDKLLPLWLVWPTLLTFAPLVAEALRSDLDQTISHGSVVPDWGALDGFRLTDTANECRWKRTPLMTWANFEKCYATG